MDKYLLGTINCALTVLIGSYLFYCKYVYHSECYWLYIINDNYIMFSLNSGGHPPFLDSPRAFHEPE